MKKIVAICKKTKKVFDDFKNTSGALTKHLLDTYENFENTSSFIKRQYRKKYGKFWHEQFFDIVEIEIEQEKTKKCPYCNWTTKDVDNKSGQFSYHLLKKHKITIENYLNDFPLEETLFKTFVKERKDKKEMLSNEDNFITCKICNKQLKTLTNTHLKKHDMNLEDYRNIFPNEEYHSSNFINKTTKNLKVATTKIKKSFISKPELSLKEFLTSIDIDFEKNNRKFLNGVEIDIINHQNKIGIEFNGNLYHSEKYGGKLKKFHLLKTELMNKKEYSLIHIFEDEWELKNEIVKNKLKHIFNKSSAIKIHARKCQVNEVDSNTKNIFLNNNHIQGEDRSNIHLGAFCDNKLVAIMTFDNNRQMNGKNDVMTYELKRFCVDINYTVVGIAGKLLSYFIKTYNPNKIISFADRRWTLDKKNNLYVKLGFKLTKILSPDYTYYNSKISRLKRFHKFSFGKSSLREKFPEIYSKNKTEWEMMQELGYDRIWDCGKFKYEMTF